jgi:hypothetical protein
MLGSLIEGIGELVVDVAVETGVADVVVDVAETICDELGLLGDKKKEDKDR